VYFVSDDDKKESHSLSRPLLSSGGTSTDVEQQFINNTVHFQKMWSSEPEIQSRCKLVAKQVSQQNLNGLKKKIFQMCDVKLPLMFTLDCG
jgi:hypothetical protein